MNKTFWKLKNSVEGSDGAKLYIDGPISEESWWGDEATPAQLRQELKQINGKTLEVVLNSPGGDVWAGVAMHDALKELDAEVTIKVSGLAASIASVIAMAGDRIVITPGSTMMVHKASMLAMGNSDDMAKAIEMLETVEDGIVSIYADRTGQSEESVRSMMKAETWMSAEKAVELGFADAVVKPEVSEDTADEPKSLLKGNFAFSMKATQDSIDSFLGKAKAEEEAEPVAEDTPEEGETAPVPEKEPDTVPPVEGTEEETKPTNKKETMKPEDKKPEAPAEAPEAPAPQEAIAQAQVIAPSAQAPVDPKASPKNYLDSKESIVDFSNILVANAGKDAKEVKAAWGEHLAVKMGVTNPEVLLPGALVTKIEDAFEEGGQIWNLVNKTGLTVLRVTRDTVTGEDSRAAGYNRDDEATKREELITLADRTLRPQFIYKYITLNKEDIKENRDTGALVTYVLTELPRRIVREVERAIVIGDGRDDGTDYKITSFVSLKDDAEDNVFVKQYDPGVDESRYESLIRARALVKADGAKYLVAKTDYLTDLLLEQGVNGGYLFQPGTNLGAVFGFAGVISPDWLDDDEDNDAYIFVPSAYNTVGDNSIEAFTNFLLSTNKQEYLQEIYAGGAMTKLNAGVAIAASTS